MSKWNLSWLVGVIGIALVGLSLIYSAPAGIGLQEKHANMKLIVDVLEEVREKYVKPIPPEKERDLVENMINGGLEKLDPYSGFMGVEEYKEFNKQSTGKFGGIGIRIGVDARQVFVESPMVGTPAYEAGVQAGDVIMKIDGQSTENMSLRKVVDLIQGDAGTKVTLTVLHEGAKDVKDAVDIPIVRADISIESVLGDQRMKDKLKEWNFWIDPQSKIAYVRVVAFTEKTVPELTKVVDLLQRTGMKGLVVDLRNNPGGLLQAAVEVSSIFLPENQKVVTTKGRDKSQEKTYLSKHANLNMKNPGGNYPLVILINRYSASASEIVSAALQDYARAVIVGERSFGKGSVQNVIRMENDTTALKLTTASYWRPSGRNIHRFPDSKETDEWGVKPNKGFEVKLTDEERLEYYKYRRDRDIVRNGPAPEKKKDEVKKDGAKKDDKAKEPFHDRVLDKAVEYIRGQLNKTEKGSASAPQGKPRPAPGRPADADDAPEDNLGAILPGRAGPAALFDWSRA